MVWGRARERRGPGSPFTWLHAFPHSGSVYETTEPGELPNASHRVADTMLEQSLWRFSFFFFVFQPPPTR